MAIEPIKGFYVHDEATDTDGVAKVDYAGLVNAPEAERYCDITSELSSGYINTNFDIGTTIDPEVHSGNWRHMVFQCKAGDSFGIIGQGGNSPLLWVLTDEEYTLLEKGSQGEVHTQIPVIVNVSQDGYIIINTNLTASRVDYYKLESIVEIDERCEELEEKAEKGAGLVTTITGPSKLHFEFGYIKTNGTADTNSVKNIYTPDFIFAFKGSTIACDNDYKINVAEYIKNGNDYTLSKFSNFTDTGKLYTVTQNCYIRFTEGTVASIVLTDTSITEHLTLNIESFELFNAFSPVFKKPFNFGDNVAERYAGKQNNYTGFDTNTTYTDFITDWDGLVSSYGDVLTKTSLGNSSYTLNENPVPLYLYDFNPLPTTGELNKKLKYIIVAGIHGFEKANAFGLYYLVKDILENWDKNAGLAYMRKHLRLLIIPFVNPYGFDNNTYTNANGVNINRNFSYNWEPETEGNQASGAAPFDQPESQIIRNLVISNKDAFHYIDSHSNGSDVVADWPKVNWLSLADVNNDSSGIAKGNTYYQNMIEAAYSQVEENTLYFANEFSLAVPAGKALGYVSLDGTGKSSSAWVREQGTLSITMEGFNGFPNGTKWSADCIRANSEIIGNWILRMANKYRNA